MEGSKLLSEKRQVEREQEPENFLDYPISEFERDYKAIISSSAFRRLQDKTQVFPLDKSDFVRTRLTHSIEVSTIARQLGITRSGVNAWEMGISVPSTQYVVELARLFHVSSDYILGIENTATLDVSGLTEDDITLIYQIINHLKKGN